MNNVISLSFEGITVQFNLDGWINATRAAARFGKVPNEWLRLSSTREYLKKLAVRVPVSNTGKSRITFVTARRGNSADSGTWIHPRLAVKFARWLSDLGRRADRCASARQPACNGCPSSRLQRLRRSQSSGESCRTRAEWLEAREARPDRRGRTRSQSAANDSWLGEDGVSEKKWPTRVLQVLTSSKLIVF